MISSSGFHLTLPVWLFLSFTFSLTVSPSVPAAKLTFIQLVACFSSTVWWLLRHVWMSKCHTCPRKLITLQSEYIHIILASPPRFLAWRFWRERQGSCCWLGGWDLVSMWLYSVKPARRRRWTLTAAEVASDRGDEVEQIADWQLSSITCPTSQMQVDRKGHVG